MCPSPGQSITTMSQPRQPRQGGVEAGGFLGLGGGAAVGVAALHRLGSRGNGRSIPLACDEGRARRQVVGQRRLAGIEVDARRPGSRRAAAPTIRCIAAVDLPEPPFSLPSTMIWARRSAVTLANPTPPPIEDSAAQAPCHGRRRLPIPPLAPPISTRPCVVSVGPCRNRARHTPSAGHFRVPRHERTRRPRGAGHAGAAARMSRLRPAADGAGAAPGFRR